MECAEFSVLLWWLLLLLRIDGMSHEDILWEKISEQFPEFPLPATHTPQRRRLTNRVHLVRRSARGPILDAGLSGGSRQRSKLAAASSIQAWLHI